MNIYNKLESSVRSYCRNFPITIDKAIASNIWTTNGEHYIDFLMGCGSLNLGHNPPLLRKALLEYILDDGVAMSLDFHSRSKEQFLQSFDDVILKPRDLNYKIQFTGPTGTNAVEAACKIARKVTNRKHIVAFTNGFHGCSLGALALTGSKYHRGATNTELNNVYRLPFDGYMGTDTLEHLSVFELAVLDPSSGIDAPAAIIVETIQGEGGLNVATAQWMNKLQSVCQSIGALLIVDDIQAGCGRSGDFFSFESLGVKPDIVTLAKSISGFGLPMSLVLIKPELDVLAPAEHNGTFRGNNHAFVTASAMLNQYWAEQSFRDTVQYNVQLLTNGLNQIASEHHVERVGRGMMQGIKFSSGEIARNIQQACFDMNLIIELCGPLDQVVKFLPAINIDSNTLINGLEIFSTAVTQTLSVPQLEK